MAIFSGQKAVSTAGTAVRLHDDMTVNAAVMVKALNSNSGRVFVGNAGGDVDSNHGMPLAAGESLVLHWVSNLRQIWLDAENDGDGVAWLILVC